MAAETEYKDVTKEYNNKSIRIFSTAAQQYVGARLDMKDSPLIGMETDRFGWMVFWVQVDDEGWASLIADNGLYLTTALDENEELPPIRATAAEASRWEKFRFFKMEYQCAIQSKCNQKWLTCRIDWPTKDVLASCTSVRRWEMFEVKIASDLLSHVKVSDIIWNDPGNPRINVSITGASFREFETSPIDDRLLVYDVIEDRIQKLEERDFHRFELVRGSESDFTIIAHQGERVIGFSIRNSVQEVFFDPIEQDRFFPVLCD